MANKTERLAENVAGPWYVDSTCIDCDLCRETAPNVFRRDDENGSSVVYHQPDNADDLARAMEAKEGCPVEAIGNDGGGAPANDQAPAIQAGSEGGT